MTKNERFIMQYGRFDTSGLIDEARNCVKIKVNEIIEMQEYLKENNPFYPENFDTEIQDCLRDAAIFERSCQIMDVAGRDNVTIFQYSNATSNFHQFMDKVDSLTDEFLSQHDMIDFMLQIADLYKEDNDENSDWEEN